MRAPRTDQRAGRRCFIRHERLLGWRDPIAAGIDWAIVPVGSSPGSDAETGYRAAAPLLDRADQPTAIICLRTCSPSASCAPRPSAASVFPRI